MPVLDTLSGLLLPFVPLLVVIAIFVLLLWGARWLLLRGSLALEQDHKLPE